MRVSLRLQPRPSAVEEVAGAGVTFGPVAGNVQFVANSCVDTDELLDYCVWQPGSHKGSHPEILSKRSLAGVLGRLPRDADNPQISRMLVLGILRQLERHGPLSASFHRRLWPSHLRPRARGGGSQSRQACVPNIRSRSKLESDANRDERSAGTNGCGIAMLLQLRRPIALRPARSSTGDGQMAMVNDRGVQFQYTRISTARQASNTAV